MRRVALSILVVLCIGGAARPLPTRVILVGDSTVQPASGYGEKLCQRFKPDTVCINVAKGGRSTKSFREEGRWDAVLASLKEGKGSYGPTFVLIQFGHNDAGSVPHRHTELPEFTENTRVFVRQVRSLGATPVLVTPLTTRAFRNGRVSAPDLEPRAAAVRQVATEERTILLDLFKDSMEAVQKMGPTEADTLAQAPPYAQVVAASLTGTSYSGPAPQPQPTPAFDFTHVGDKGAMLFSGIVADEIKAKAPELGRRLR